MRRNRREPEGAYLTRITTYIILFVMLTVFSHITERDNHPFHDRPVYQVEARS